MYRNATGEKNMNSNIETLIYTAANTGTTRNLAQQSNAAVDGFPFGDLLAIEAYLTGRGNAVQQINGDRMLVNHNAWVTTGGVCIPVSTRNL